jgi:predicted DNA-binding transcriptional regulator AlpA
MARGPNKTCVVAFNVFRATLRDQTEIARMAAVTTTDLERTEMVEHAASPFMRRDELKDIHPVSDRTRQRAEAAGLFPRRIQLAPHIPGWRRSEVAQWQADPNAWAMRA